VLALLNSIETLQTGQHTGAGARPLMNVVDSSAWLSYFSGDANADVFSEPIENTEQLIVPSITLTEVFKCIYRLCNENKALDSSRQCHLRNWAKIQCCDLDAR
jgi:predicted nucleic acid-binding protein